MRRKLSAGPQLTYTEKAESNLGPFIVEARLLSVDRATLYSSGTGKVGLDDLQDAASIHKMLHGRNLTWATLL